jgi:4-hydroxy-4-methyl-2-oxoglutarate aldolase
MKPRGQVIMSAIPGNDILQETFRHLSTPLIADACVRLGQSLRVAPPSLRALAAPVRFAGRVLPVRHYGSVDIFLEALQAAQDGDVLVIDNGGRMDEACIGDLVVLEAQGAGIAGIVVWGYHRDTPDLIEIGLPVISLGSTAPGPVRLEEREAEALISARIGDIEVRNSDILFADADGVIVVDGERVAETLATAAQIRDTERRQAEMMRAGINLRAQLRFAEYLARRAEHPSYSFRQHLRRIGGAVEE